MMVKEEPYFYRYTMSQTNSSIRALLGERGFIEDKRMPIDQMVTDIDGDRKITFWKRGEEILALHEFISSNKAPELWTHNKVVRHIANPELQLGYRNLEIQNDGSRDE